MIRKKFAIVVFICLAFCVLGFSASNTQAQSPADGGTEFVLSYPKFADVQNPGDFVVSLYNYALGISGTLAVIMIVYGGIKYVVNAGNISNLNEAKDIIFNAVFGIVLLAGAYLILNTINPSLTNIKKQLGNVKPIPIASSTGEGIPGGSQGDISSLANQIKSNPKIELSPSATCANGSDARSTIEIVANTGMPLVCDPQCNCKRGGINGKINLSTLMLSGILNAVVKLEQPPAYITSFTGGQHAASSLHYQGRAADFVLTQTKNPQDWTNFAGSLKASGASRAFCEVPIEVGKQCDKKGNNCKEVCVAIDGTKCNFVNQAINKCDKNGSCSNVCEPTSTSVCKIEKIGKQVNCKELFDAGGKRKSGAHIHAEW